jgi:spore coat assembly protein
MKQGDLVVRKSYGGDILFRVSALTGDLAVLRGTEYRLLADAPMADLQPVRETDEPAGVRQARILSYESLRRLEETRRRLAGSQVSSGPGRQPSFFEMPGKVLHLDGDPVYLRRSMAVYRQLGVPAAGVYAHESRMAETLAGLLPRVRPDIVVITGHDGILKSRANLYDLSSYRNSINFVRAVSVVRQYERNRDGLVVIAGACQSHFEALIQAGANFASSPGRIMIHALDPVYVAVRASRTPFRENIDIRDVIANTISGVRGVGGVETMGRYRVGTPHPAVAAPNLPAGGSVVAAGNPGNGGSGPAVNGTGTGMGAWTINGAGIGNGMGTGGGVGIGSQPAFWNGPAAMWNGWGRGNL